MRIPRSLAGDSSKTLADPAPADRDSAQSLIARLERLQEIADLSDVAADEIAQAELLLSSTLSDCSDSYIASAADRLRAAQRLMSGLDEDTDVPPTL